MELNEKLQMLRKQKGITQQELAAALFVSRTQNGVFAECATTCSLFGSTQK